MPISGYYGGRGARVAASMKRRYGPDWRRVFYATANKTDMKPGTVENRRAALKALQDDRRKKRK